MKQLFIICLTTFLFMQFASAQITITGKVTNKKSKTPIEGAAIIVKGYKMPSVITDNKGNYTINVPEGAKILEVSSTGMKTITIEIGKKKNINFKMIPYVSDNKMNKKEIYKETLK